MTCRELVDATGDYVAGELPPAARAEADEHLAGCPDCTAYLESYRATIALTKVAFDGEPGSLPDPVVVDLLARRKR
jgi:anti-sigma factor RsiW